MWSVGLPLLVATSVEVKSSLLVNTERIGLRVLGMPMMLTHNIVTELGLNNG